MGIEESLKFGRVGRLRVILQNRDEAVKAGLDLGVWRVRSQSSEDRLSFFTESVPGRSSLTGRYASCADRRVQLAFEPSAVLRAEGART